MNRRKFFAFIGIGAVSAVVPKAFASTPPARLLAITKMQQQLLIFQLKEGKTPISWANIHRKMNIPDPEVEIEEYFREQERIEKENIEFYLRVVKPALKSW